MIATLAFLLLLLVVWLERFQEWQDRRGRTKGAFDLPVRSESSKNALGLELTSMRVGRDTCN